MAGTSRQITVGVFFALSVLIGVFQCVWLAMHGNYVAAIWAFNYVGAVLLLHDW